MTEGNNVENSVGQSAPQAPDNGSQPAQASVPPVGAVAQPAEKMLPQSKVDEVVKAVKYETYQRAQRDFEKQQAQQVPQQQIPQPQSVGNAPLTEEQIRKIAQEEQQRTAEQLYYNQIVNDFARKMDVGKTQHEDFENSVNNLNLQALPNVVLLANQMENTAEIMYQLSKNPGIADNIERAAYVTRDGGLSSMQQFVDSLKQNQVTAPKTPNEPLSQVKPSVTGTDNGSLTLRDYKKIYRG